MLTNASQIILSQDIGDSGVSGSIITLNASKKTESDSSLHEDSTATGETEELTKVPPSIYIQESQRVPIYLKETLRIPGNTRTIYPISTSKKFEEDSLVIFEHEELQPGVILASVVTPVRGQSLHIEILNSNPHETTFKAGNKLCSAEVSKLANATAGTEVSDETTVIKTSIENNELSQGNSIRVVSQQDMSQKQVNNTEELRPITENDVNTLKEELRAPLVKLLNKYRNTCWLPGESLGKYTGSPSLEIPLKEDRVVNVPPYKIYWTKSDNYFLFDVGTTDKQFKSNFSFVSFTQ